MITPGTVRKAPEKIFLRRYGAAVGALFTNDANLIARLNVANLRRYRSLRSFRRVARKLSPGRSLDRYRLRTFGRFYGNADSASRWIDSCNDTGGTVLATPPFQLDELAVNLARTSARRSSPRCPSSRPRP